MERFEITIVSETSEGHQVQDRIVALMEQYGFSPKDVFGVRLAIEEALVNAIKHGNGMDPDKSVFVSCEIHDQDITIVIRDEGEGFNPEDVPDPTEDDNLEKPSGRGLMLIKAFMTEVIYNDRGNEVTLIKRCGEEEGDDD